MTCQSPSDTHAGDGQPPHGSRSRTTALVLAEDPSRRQLVERPDDPQLLGARLVRVRRPAQWVSAAAVTVLFAMLVNTLVTNERFQWPLAARYFLDGSILRGLVLTVWMTAAVMVCGFLLGIGLAAMRLSSNVILRTLSFGYVSLIRSVPPLVQLLFWYPRGRRSARPSPMRSMC